MNGLLFSLLVVGSTSAVAGGDFDLALLDGRLVESKDVAPGPLADILSTARDGQGGFDRLADLCDNIGARLAGSKALEAAVEWSVVQLTEAGADKVWTEPVMVPHWVRGHESAQMLSPRIQQLNVLGLGGTVAGVVEGDVVVLGGLEEVDAAVKGKIVLFDSPMGDSYGS
jgi:carboxypeptidase Q